MLFYSHMWDLALKLASLVAITVLLVSLHVQERLVAAGLPDGPATFILVCLLGAVWALLYRQYLSTVATWLYARGTLGARISFAEARLLARLFQLDVSMKWVPMKEVRQLPPEQRRVALLSALDVHAKGRRAMLL
jgi:hypothetical protein